MEAKYESGFAASGEITVPNSAITWQTEVLILRTKAKVLRCQKKAGGFDLMCVNVRHLVTADGEIYSGLCTI